MSSRWRGTVLAAAGLAAAATGAYLMTIVTDAEGASEFHGFGSLGLALLVSGAVVAILSALLVARPEAMVSARQTFADTVGGPGRTLAAGLGVGVVAIVLIAITADVGGFVLYHPYDWLGIELGLVAIALVIRGMIGLRRT